MSFRLEVSRGNKRAVSQKGGLGQCALVPVFGTGEYLHVPSFGTSGFWYRGKSECTLVPVFGNGEHPPKPPFWKPPLCEAPKLCNKLQTFCESTQLYECSVTLVAAAFNRELLGLLSLIERRVLDLNVLGDLSRMGESKSHGG